MAAIPATISLNWISNFAGPHRVCYRIVGQPTYTCTVPTPGIPTHPNCPGGGGACGYIINIMVDQETCDTINYEGYVQPTCEDEASLANRTPFNVAFVPSPACLRWEARCATGGVDEILIIGGGSGYTPGSNPTVTIVGDGVGAAATATVDGTGSVVSIVVDIPGGGYTTPPTILIAGPGGPGVTATASATLIPCPGFTLPNCDGTGPETTFPIAVGDLAAICGTTEPGGLPDEYVVVGSGNCLCDCINIDIENNGVQGDLNVTYIDCVLQAKVELTIPAASSLDAVCIVNGSLTYEELLDASINIINNGTCDGDGI